MPEPIIKKPSDYFNVLTYTGTGATQTISGLTFQPDWVWIKSRSGATDHKLTDAVRGATKSLESNTTDAEATDSNGITAFTSTGFTLGSDSVYNNNGSTYVAWCWKANGSGSTNTAGSITSTVSANTTAGFSIVTYTSPNSSSNQTVGHGLGVKPSMIIVKNRDSGFNWDIYHSSLGYNSSLIFTTAGTRSGAFGAEPTSTVFTTTNTYTHNGTDKYVAYCFAPVAGYSAFGSYTGNGSTDGPFIFTGFRPRYVLIKNANGTASANTGWYIFDAARNTYNTLSNPLRADLSDAESSGYAIDFLSNGFKLRISDAGTNSSAGATHIYACFAENPFKYANAR